MIAFLDRLVRGPCPPHGVPYEPASSLRCRVGLHLWAEVWEALKVDSRLDDEGRWIETMRLVLDRPADYESCCRCHARRHARRLARRFRRLIR